MTAAAANSVLPRRFASASPGAVLGQRSFWLRQRGFVTAVAVFLLGVIVLAPQTYGAAGRWEWLSIVIQLLAAWAAIAAARALAAIEVEVAIVAEVERKGSAYLRDLKSGQRTRIDLDQLEETMLPTNPTVPAPAMIRLFQHICKEARDRRFESSVQVMQPYREEQIDEIFKLQNLQKIALWLGILGTFIGLMKAVAAAATQKGAFEQIVTTMIDGLKIAFSASLAGLEVAVFLGVLLLVLRKAQEHYFKQMEAAVVTMLSLARNSVNKDEYLAEFAQIRETVNDLTETVHEHAQEIKQQTDEIRTGMGRLAETKLEFDSFLRQMSESQKTFIDDIHDIYDVLSLKNLADNLLNALSQAMKAMSTRMEISSNQITNRLADFNSSVDVLTKALESQARESAGTAKQLATQITTANNENITASRAIVGRLQELQTRDTTTISAMRSDLQELSRKVAALTGVIERTGQIQTGPRSFRDLMVWLFR